MIASSNVTLDTTGLDALMARLPGEMAVATQLAADLLRPIAEDNVEAMGAVDTRALYESLYVSVRGGSQYEESVASAAQAYQFNPTRYASIREANGGNLKVDPPVRSRSPYVAYLAVAAAHGKAVEEGYVSAFGNDIPARPFMQQTAQDGFGRVVEEYRQAIIRALR